MTLEELGLAHINEVVLRDYGEVFSWLDEAEELLGDVLCAGLALPESARADLAGRIHKAVVQRQHRHNDAGRARAAAYKVKKRSKTVKNDAYTGLGADFARSAESGDDDEDEG